MNDTEYEGLRETIMDDGARIERLERIVKRLRAKSLRNGMLFDRTARCAIKFRGLLERTIAGATNVGVLHTDIHIALSAGNHDEVKL